MSRINWKLVAFHLAEAREQIEELEQLASQPRRRGEGVQQIGLEHAYHHVNFAWNARLLSEAQNRHLTDSQFRSHSRYPKNLRPLGVDLRTEQTMAKSKKTKRPKRGA